MAWDDDREAQRNLGVGRAWTQGPGGLLVPPTYTPGGTPLADYVPTTNAPQVVFWAPQVAVGAKAGVIGGSGWQVKQAGTILVSGDITGATTNLTITKDGGRHWANLNGGVSQPVDALAEGIPVIVFPGHLFDISAAADTTVTFLSAVFVPSVVGGGGGDGGLGTASTNIAQVGGTAVPSVSGTPVVPTELLGSYATAGQSFPSSRVPIAVEDQSGLVITPTASSVTAGELSPLYIGLLTRSVLMAINPPTGGNVGLYEAGSGSNILGSPYSGAQSIAITSATTTAVKSSAGVIGTISNASGAASVGTLQVYDNTAGSGKLLVSLPVGTPAYPPIPVGIPCGTGITVVTSSNSDSWAVSYA